MRKRKAMKTAMPEVWQIDDFRAFALGPQQQKHIKGGGDGDGDGDGVGHEDLIDL
ncbi:MAG: hypothetical protein KDD06_20680 [Phaeodactylibacter sp.]|nr:hypothetical protein [candidate division KSB1 bacterium]MCB0587720.1 hypothetical protein [Phaeodactylibacter sp.]MCB9286944.1 hypothetical protein [Lewinellaceae bacterium]